MAVPTADDLGVVRRGGDVMTGGLTINRGGLEVLSGGVTCRGANVTTLEASNVVKAAKVIADAIELRGELTFDNTRRVVQCRMIEGRQGSSRKDGALHLNGRGGAEVVVGNAEQARGMEVHGPLGAGALVVGAGALAQVFEASGGPVPADVVRIVGDGTRVGRTRKAFDPAVVGGGLCRAGLAHRGGCSPMGASPSRSRGSSPATSRRTARPSCRGDLLAASAVPGHARKVDDPSGRPGAILGKALEPLPRGRGTIRVLVRGG